MEVLLAGNNGKEERKTYNFHASQAQIVRLHPADPNSLLVLRCNQCELGMKVLYDLVSQMNK